MRSLANQRAWTKIHVQATKRTKARINWRSIHGAEPLSKRPSRPKTAFLGFFSPTRFRVRPKLQKKELQQSQVPRENKMTSTKRCVIRSKRLVGSRGGSTVMVSAETTRIASSCSGSLAERGPTPWPAAPSQRGRCQCRSSSTYRINPNRSRTMCATYALGGLEASQGSPGAAQGRTRRGSRRESGEPRRTCKVPGAARGRPHHDYVRVFREAVAVDLLRDLHLRAHGLHLCVDGLHVHVDAQPCTRG